MYYSEIEEKHPEHHKEFLNYILRTSIEIEKAGGIGSEVLLEVLDCRKTREFLFSSFMNNLHLRFEPPKQRKGFDEEFENKEEDSEDDDGGNP